MLAPLVAASAFVLLPLLVVVLAVAGSVWGVVAIARASQRRKLEYDAVWSGWARARGWGYRQHWPQMVDRFHGTPFGTGSQRRAERGFWGRFDNVEVFGFWYSYLVSTGKNSHWVHQMVCGVRFPGARFPMVRVTPEALFNSGHDIDFENHAFNSFFHVTSPSARFAHDLLHPRTMELLLRTTPASVLWTEGDALLSSMAGERTPMQVDAQLRQLTEFAGLMPHFLLKGVGGGPMRPDLSGPAPVGLAVGSRVGLAPVQRPAGWFRRRP